MSRPKKAMPAYRYHISGQAVVTLGGKDFYLGQYDTPQSRSRYLSLLSEYNSNGLQTPNQPTHQDGQPITVRCVTAEFRESIANRSAELNRFGRLLVALEDDYGDEPAADFGPRKLAAMRELFIAAGNCRSYCNSQTRQIVRIFKYAVSGNLSAPKFLRAYKLWNHSGAVGPRRGSQYRVSR